MAAIAACVDDDMTDLEKLTALHDWICLHVDYGVSPDSETAYGALVKGKGVCVGYASGYAYVAALAGLNGVMTYSETIDHAWILATLDGARYFSDATWDDGKYQRMGLIRHSYFLFDADNAADTHHVGWDSGEAVPGGALELVPWRDAVTRVIFDGDYAWYIDDTFTLWRCDRDTWQTRSLLTLDIRWPDADPDDGAAPEIYAGLVLNDGRLWFATPYDLRSVDTDGGDMRTELAPELDDEIICGVGVRNGVIVYTRSESFDALLYDVIETDIPAANAWGYAAYEPEAKTEPEAESADPSPIAEKLLVRRFLAAM